MKALVNGITGFAGTHLAEHLLARGDHVLGCSLNANWRDGTPESVRQAVEIVAFDLTQPLDADISRRISEFAPDCIYHLAGMSVPAKCGESQPNAAAIDVNVRGTRVIAALAASLPTTPRVMVASSCYVYAPVDPTQPVVSERSTLGPVTGYGKTKLAAEQVLLNAVSQYDVDGVIARVFQHSGPRQPPVTMLAEWARKMVRGDDPIEVISLDSHLDLTDVRDVVRAYRLLVESGGRGEIYNVGSGRSVSGSDVMNELRRQHDPQRAVIETSPGRRQNPIADVGKLVSQTDWRPTIALPRTVADTLTFWKTRDFS